MTMLRISAPHFVAGIIPGQRGAPILRYMARWLRADIEAYCARKRWSCEVVP